MDQNSSYIISRHRTPPPQNVKFGTTGSSGRPLLPQKPSAASDTLVSVSWRPGTGDMAFSSAHIPPHCGRPKKSRLPFEIAAGAAVAVDGDGKKFDPTTSDVARLDLDCETPHGRRYYGGEFGSATPPAR